MPKFRKRPITVEAHQFFADDNKTHEHVNYGHMSEGHPLTGRWWVQTLEGPLRVSDGDWIITGIEGEHYPCKPIIFESTYEPVK